MERIYIDNDMARFTRKDRTLVDVAFKDGKTFENLEPRRLFPVSNAQRYIALLDENGTEQAVIRDLNNLPSQEQAIIRECLSEYYLIPKIQRVVDCDERFDGLTLHTETDRGPAKIEIRTLMQGLKLFDGRRVLVRDMNDNRYEIPDWNKIDSRSRQILSRYI